MKKSNLSDVTWEDRFDHQKALLFGENELHSKGTKFQIIKILPGKEIQPHYHKIRTEVFYILKGRGIITLGDENMECKEDDFMLCPTNTTHAFKNKSNEDFIIAVFRTNDPGDSDMLWVKDK